MVGPQQSSGGDEDALEEGELPHPESEAARSCKAVIDRVWRNLQE
jgi:hypothetical protein